MKERKNLCRDQVEDQEAAASAAAHAEADLAAEAALAADTIITEDSDTDRDLGDLAVFTADRMDTAAVVLAVF